MSINTMRFFMKKFFTFVMAIYFIFALASCQFFNLDDKKSEHWEGFIYSADSTDVDETQFLAYGNYEKTIMNMKFSKTSGKDEEMYGLRFNFMDSKNYYEFLINNKGEYILSQIVDGEEVTSTKVAGIGSYLNRGQGKTNTIKAVVSLEEGKVKFFGNIELDATEDAFSLGTIDYAEETFGHIFFVAYIGKENLSQEPLNVNVTVLKEEDEEPFQDDNAKKYETGKWSSGVEDSSDEGYDVFYANTEEWLNSCEYKILPDNFDKNADNDIRLFTIGMVKDSGAFNYGGGIAFACSEVNSKTGIPNKNYVLSIDTHGYWKLLKICGNKIEEASKEVYSEFSCVETDVEAYKLTNRFNKGFKTLNNITIYRMNENDGSGKTYYSWCIWVNPEIEITVENASSMLEKVSLKLVDMTDSALDSGLIGFAPGIGSKVYEDLPLNPVKYRFKRVPASWEKTEDNESEGGESEGGESEGGESEGGE